MATLIEVTGSIVAAHVTNYALTTEELLLEIGKVHAALKNLEAGEAAEEGEAVKPSLSIKDAFKKDEVVCLVCGKGGFKTLTRHLHAAHQLKPGAYRKQFGIPSGQSLSAMDYAKARRKLALDRGLADNLVKARGVRMANLEAKKAAEPVKAKGPAKTKAKA